MAGGPVPRGEWLARLTVEVGSVNYTEVGISAVVTVGSNLFARILLAGTVTVTSGQQLRITYELAITHTDTNRPTVAMPSSIGWPYTYTIQSISSTGANFTVVLNETHHYVAGGAIIIAGAKRPRFTISAASSTGSDFTLTTTAPHGKSPGDSIIVEGVTPSGYNGTWTCASGTTGSTIIVTSLANPGTGTVFGNVRLAEPGTWYDGTWTVASVAGANVTVTSALNLGAAGLDGTVKNNLNASYCLNHWGVVPLGGSSGTYGTPVSPDVAAQWGGSLAQIFTNGCSMDGVAIWNTATAHLYDKTSAITAPGTFPLSAAYAGTGGTKIACTTATKQTYVAGAFYVEVWFEWATSSANVGTLRGLFLSAVNSNSDNGCLAWLFDQPQRKASTNKLTFKYRISWGRTLA